MTLTLAATALVMGIAGSPHCVVMCGATCGAMSRGPQGTARFQAGRLLGYAAAGAVAGAAAQSLGWLATNVRALQPAWVLLHAGVLVWGLMLLLGLRQPQWVESAGRALWSRARRLAQARNGAFAAGALWAFMPCGLLYSALLIASLAGGPVQGGVCMALFAIGSGVPLAFAPALVRRLRSSMGALRGEKGTRLAGALLAAAAVWALVMDLGQRIAPWCA